MKKHLLTLLITIFMCALLTASISAAYPIGDVNNDGVFSVLDILGILTKLSADSLTEDELYTADFNRDGNAQ